MLEGFQPFLYAIAFNVVDADINTESPLVIIVPCDSDGSVPSTVYRIIAPVVEQIIIEYLDDVYTLEDKLNVGASTVSSC